MLYPRSWYNNATARVMFLVATDDIVWTKVSIKTTFGQLFFNGLALQGPTPGFC